ncbi:MAG: hypothetical protein Q9225_005188, partial [Loekoesia sp. 1 TL-2023]
MDASGDKATISSETPSSWERALESQEQSFKNEIEDLKEDHAAEVGELRETIAKLEAESKAAKSRKAYVEKNAKKMLGKKDVELSKRQALFEAAQSEISSKDIILHESRVNIERLERESAYSSSRYAALQNQHSYTQEWEVAPLRQEVARLALLSLDYEQRIAAQSTRILILQAQGEAQPNVAELQARLTGACTQRDSFKAQFEKCQQLFHQAINELNQAKDQINSQHVRLCGYRYEHEDDPAFGAQTDGLIKQKDEEYRLLEKKANDTFLLWKKGNESHEHEKIMLDARIEELKGTIDNLEGDLNFAQEESARLTSVAEEYIAKAEMQTEKADEMQAALYEASQKTVTGLKKKLKNREIQLANCEKTLFQQRAEVQVRDMMLEKKDSELRALEGEKIDAERAVENMESKLEFREADFRDELDAKDQDIQHANKQIEELQLDICAIAQSEEASSAARTIAGFQSQNLQLRQQIENLEAEQYQKAYERQNKDFHEATCAASSELNSKIQQQNWENAQQEIEKLKRHIELIGQGCDPEKFDLARDYDELRKKKDALMRMLFEKTESMTTTMDEHTAGTQEKLHDAQAQIRLLRELAENLCVYLREAWSVGAQDGKLSLEEYQAAADRLVNLDEIQAAVRSMTADLPDEEIQGNTDGDEADFAIYDDNEAPVGDQENDADEGVASDRPLNIPPSTLPDPWEYITGSHQLNQPQPTPESDLRAPSSCPDEHTPDESQNQPGLKVTLDYTTSSSDWYTVESSQDASGPANHCIQSDPDQGAEPKTEHEEGPEEELISPSALALQQNLLSVERGWILTQSPRYEWGHEYLTNEDLAQAWADFHGYDQGSAEPAASTEGPEPRIFEEGDPDYPHDD